MASPTAALALINSWPVDTAAACIIDRNGVPHFAGDREHRFRLASVTKLFTAWTALVACEEGSTSLDASVGQPGCSLRHLLSHAGGYGFDAPMPIVSAGRRRTYSNTGYELVAAHVEQVTAIPFWEYLAEAVLEPLDIHDTDQVGSAARDMHLTIDDVARFAAELRRPALVSRATYNDAISVQYPELDGVVPGIGRFDPCPWGLGPEIRGAKHPHWTATRNSGSTFGHFGGSGTFVWVDPVADVAVAALADRDFGDWSLAAWPVFGDAVLDDLARQ